MIALLLLLLLLTSCVWSVTIEEDPITKADTTFFDNDTTKKDTIEINIEIDTTMIEEQHPIVLNPSVVDWEEVEENL